MKMTVVGSGLRAVTKEHGLTEYWANRITYCTAHPSYPRVFCWIYRYIINKITNLLILCKDNLLKCPFHVAESRQIYLVTVFGHIQKFPLTSLVKC